MTARKANEPSDGAVIAIVVAALLLPIGVGQGAAYAFGAGGKMHLLAFMVSCIFDMLAICALIVAGHGREE